MLPPWQEFNRLPTTLLVKTAAANAFWPITRIAFSINLIAVLNVPAKQVPKKVLESVVGDGQLREENRPPSPYPQMPE